MSHTRYIHLLQDKCDKENDRSRKQREQKYEYSCTKFKQKRYYITSIFQQAKQQYDEKLATELRNIKHNSKAWYNIRI